jgi:hypothetical protein
MRHGRDDPCSSGSARNTEPAPRLRTVADYVDLAAATARTKGGAALPKGFSR